MQKLIGVAPAILLAALLTGCGEKEGPAEQVGQKVDEAVDKIAEQIDRDGPAEKAGESIDRALDNAGNRLQKAGQAIGEAVQEAGQQLEERSGG